MNGLQIFIPLNVSSKFAICGLPIRMDTYRYCTFGCKYCFANNREIMKFEKEICVSDNAWLERKLEKVVGKGNIDNTNFLEVLISNGITFHCGGMSDPFQPCEKTYRATESAINVCNKYNRHILFSTKSDTVYGANISPTLHTFQLSVTGGDESIEPNVPHIEKRLAFFNELKRNGFRVGIRIQPFIPNVTSLDIVRMFYGADNFTIEGIKLVPQNEEHKQWLLKEIGLYADDFTQMGLLNLKSEVRARLYKPFIEYFKEHNIPFSIADNDLHQIGTNYCCCGDRLVDKSSGFSNTEMVKKYGIDYAKEQLDEELFESSYRDCKCNHLFTSNRQEDCVSVQDFYDKRFYRKSSPFSPKFLIKDFEDKQEQFTWQFIERKGASDGLHGSTDSR